MSFDELELNDEFEEEELPREGGNRTFLVIAGILGFLALLALIFIAVYALVVVPRNRIAQSIQLSTLEAQNTTVAEMVAKTSTSAAQAAIIAAYTQTPTSTSMFTATSSPTALMVVPTTPVVQPTDTPNSQTATAMSLFATLDANATRLAATFTAQPPQATSIPITGFADEVGLPAMLGLACLLIAIFFLARRLRTV